MKKQFHGKMEEMPIIAGFVLSSVTRDLEDFKEYSDLFTPEYLTDFEAKRKACTELIMTDSVNVALKATTVKLREQLKELSIFLVRIEGYINMANKGTSGERFGIKKLRQQLYKGNVEGAILNGRIFLNNLTENKTFLMEKGMKQEQLDSLKTLINTIENLNFEQNDMLSRRAQNCLSNIEAFNSLWFVLQPVLHSGKAIYKANNEAKLKDYTLSHLRKRMNNEHKIDAAVTEPISSSTNN